MWYVEFDKWWNNVAVKHYDLLGMSFSKLARLAWCRAWEECEASLEATGGQVVGVHGERGHDDSPPGHRVLPEV